jgi:hypothetical protein
MRLWTISFEYLDAKGLVALWRESLLAKNVLRGKTKGYLNHPQLDRFKHSENPLVCIEKYLSEIYKESLNRGYNFNKDKIDWELVDCYSQTYAIAVTRGQLEYEYEHLSNKLIHRDYERYLNVHSLSVIEAVSMFNIIEGNNIENWEKVA